MCQLKKNHKCYIQDLDSFILNIDMIVYKNNKKPPGGEGLQAALGFILTEVSIT